MALMQTAVRGMADRLPKVISPKTHAIIDYANAGGFVLMGILLMKSKKRAGIASIICGAAEAGNVMMTDMPGGVARLYSQETHKKIDAGFATFVAAVPSLLGFSSEAKSIFFRTEAVTLAAITGLTDFEMDEEDLERRRRRRVA